MRTAARAQKNNRDTSHYCLLYFGGKRERPVCEPAIMLLTTAAFIKAKLSAVQVKGVVI